MSENTTRYKCIARNSKQNKPTSYQMYTIVTNVRALICLQTRLYRIFIHAAATLYKCTLNTFKPVI